MENCNPKELLKEDLKKYEHHLTVGDLKKFIEKHNIPDTALVLVQRVEDIYYNEHNWGVYCKEGEHSYYCREWNKNIKDEEYLRERPKLKAAANRGELQEFSEEAIQKSREQYHPVWSPVFYEDDSDDFLFLDLHY